MARKKSDKAERREKLLNAFDQLDPVKQSFAQMYLNSLVDLQHLDDMVERVRGYKETGKEYCSFCGKPMEEVNRLIASHDNTFICDYCVRKCMGIVDPDFKPPVEEEPSPEYVTDLGLDLRTENILTKAGIRTVKDLIATGPEAVKALPRLGKLSYKLIREGLLKAGVEWPS